MIINLMKCYGVLGHEKNLFIAAAEWSGKLSGGSDLIRAMQRWAGVTADGYLGPQTIRALQKKLGTPVDGVISYPSAMVKALQEWCNRQ